MLIIQTLKEKDDQFLADVISNSSRSVEQLVLEIKASNEKTKNEWILRFREKRQNSADQVRLIHESRFKRALEAYTSALQDKNNTTLDRLSKSRKRTAESLLLLKRNFDTTTDDLVVKEKLRLETEDQKQATSATYLTRVRDFFEKAEERFLKSRSESERVLLERIRNVVASSHDAWKLSLEKKDEEFRQSLVKEITTVPEGPSAQGFPTAKYDMLVLERDERRKRDIKSWRERDEKEFLTIVQHVNNENRQILLNLDKDFDTLLNTHP